jgi:hypothetical protein
LEKAKIEICLCSSGGHVFYCHLELQTRLINILDALAQPIPPTAIPTWDLCPLPVRLAMGHMTSARPASRQPPSHAPLHTRHTTAQPSSPVRFPPARCTCKMHQTVQPQLGSRLNISHTQLNVIGLVGNGKSPFFAYPCGFSPFTVGTYGSGLFLGRFVDLRGPCIPFLGAFLLLLTGYYGVRHIYDQGLTRGQLSIPYTTEVISRHTRATVNCR